MQPPVTLIFIALFRAETSGTIGGGRVLLRGNLKKKGPCSRVSDSPCSGRSRRRGRMGHKEAKQAHLEQGRGARRTRHARWPLEARTTPTPPQKSPSLPASQPPNNHNDGDLATTSIITPAYELTWLPTFLNGRSGLFGAGGRGSRGANPRGGLWASSRRASGADSEGPRPARSPTSQLNLSPACIQGPGFVYAPEGPHCTWSSKAGAEPGRT